MIDVHVCLDEILIPLIPRQDITLAVNDAAALRFITGCHQAELVIHRAGWQVPQQYRLRLITSQPFLKINTL